MRKTNLRYIISWKGDGRIEKNQNSPLDTHGLTGEEQEKRAFLSVYREAERTVELKLRELERVRRWSETLCTLAPRDRTAVKDRIRTVETELDSAVTLWSRRRNSVQRAIDGVDDPHLREILTRRYLHGEPLGQIADAMHYSQRHVMRLHRDALQAMNLPD